MTEYRSAQKEAEVVARAGRGRVIHSSVKGATPTFRVLRRSQHGGGADTVQVAPRTNLPTNPVLYDSEQLMLPAATASHSSDGASPDVGIRRGRAASPPTRGNLYYLSAMHSNPPPPPVPPALPPSDGEAAAASVSSEACDANGAGRYSDSGVNLAPAR